jgi:hypothetical protein
MARAIYDVRVTTVAHPGGNVFIRCIGGNSRRLTLTFASPTAGGVLVNNSNGGAALFAYANVNLFANAPICYRDYGTLMQDEVWVSSSVVIAVLHVIEIYLVRR